MTDRISAIVADSLDVKRRFFDAHAGDVQRAAQLIANAFKARGVGMPKVCIEVLSTPLRLGLVAAGPLHCYVPELGRAPVR